MSQFLLWLIGSNNKGKVSLTNDYTLEVKSDIYLARFSDLGEAEALRDAIAHAARVRSQSGYNFRFLCA